MLARRIIPCLDVRDGRVVIDVAFIEVSEPDEHGYCSFGVSTDTLIKLASDGSGDIVGAGGTEGNYYRYKVTTGEAADQLVLADED